MALCIEVRSRPETEFLRLLDFLSGGLLDYDKVLEGRPLSEANPGDRLICRSSMSIDQSRRADERRNKGI